jgi:benzoyl-CoA reductase subunit C
MLRRRKMEQLLNKFQQIAAEPLKTAQYWKEKTGKKVVGCMGLYVTEEIFHAAGLLPVVILEKDSPILRAQAHVQSYMCGYIRSVTDQALAGDLDFIDCIISHDCCHTIRMTTEIIKRNATGIKDIQPIFLPVTIKKAESWTYTLQELSFLIEKAEKLAARSITEDDLMQSIQTYNKHRRLLKRLYQLRRDKPGIISARQVSNIVKASMLMPKEEHNAMLEPLLEAMENKTVEANNKIPVIVSGSLCETCDEYVLDILEEVGGVVVDDDLYVGSRYFATEVDESLSPLTALALAYVNMVPPCPTRHDPDNKLSDYLINMAERARAKGIISVIVKFCEAHYYSYLTFRRGIKEFNIPEYLIETEHEEFLLHRLKRGCRVLSKV